MIGSFIERYSAKVCYGGGGGGGFFSAFSSISGGAQTYGMGSRGAVYATSKLGKTEACVAAAGVLATASYIPHPAVKAGVIAATMIAAAACR
jgi:hypothetical protein